MNRTIAFISMTNCKGGAETLIFSLHKALCSSSTLIFVANKCNTETFDGKVKYLTKSKSLVLGFFMIILAIPELNKYEYLFSSHQYLNSFLGFFKNIGLLRKPKLIFRESTSLFLRYRGIKLFCHRISYMLGYGKQSITITQSEEMKNQLLMHLKSASNWKIKTISNPIDLSDIIGKSNEYPVYEPPYIIAAGRLIPEKGFDILIESYNIIKTQINSRHLIILGDGPEKGKLLRLIEKLNLDKYIRLIGHVSNPMPYFKKADLCVVSSRIEGFPNVLLQMMALNGNVISTLCAGGIDQLNGLLVCKPNDIKSLSQTIINAFGRPRNNSGFYLNELKNRSIYQYWSTVESFLNEL